MFILQLLNHHQDNTHGFITYTDALLLITLNFLLPVQIALQVFPTALLLLVAYYLLY